MRRWLIVFALLAPSIACRSRPSTLAVDVALQAGTPPFTSLAIEVKQGDRAVVTKTFPWRPDQAHLGVFLPDDVSGAVDVAGHGLDDGGKEVATGQGSATVIPSAISDVLSLRMHGEAELCTTAGCAAPPSCGGLPHQCGPLGDQDCCASFIVPGGAFNRDNNDQYPATISRFALDAYEVTVARFRSFLIRYPSTSYPSAGNGANPRLTSATGWQVGWDAYLPPTSDSIEARVNECATPHAWTTVSGPNENRPVTCVTWYVAFAFCAWDGGRLPTEAEWSRAAVGGEQQRVYPWSNPPDAVAIDPSRASYDCASTNECNSITSLIQVGSRPGGNGRWGHADLAGNVWEWTFDTMFRCKPGQTGCVDCMDCVNDMPSSETPYRVIHGGSFMDDADHTRLDHSRKTQVVNASDYSFANDLGFRCARDP